MLFFSKTGLNNDDGSIYISPLLIVNSFDVYQALIRFNVTMISLISSSGTPASFKAMVTNRWFASLVSGRWKQNFEFTAIEVTKEPYNLQN